MLSLNSIIEAGKILTIRKCYCPRYHGPGGPYGGLCTRRSSPRGTPCFFIIEGILHWMVVCTCCCHFDDENYICGFIIYAVVVTVVVIVIVMTICIVSSSYCVLLPSFLLCFLRTPFCGTLVMCSRSWWIEWSSSSQSSQVVWNIVRLLRLLGPVVRLRPDSSEILADHHVHT